MTKKIHKSNGMKTRKAGWTVFHQRLLDWFAANPNRYQELLEEMNKRDGFTKYQGEKGVAALRQAVSRIRTGQGALREPLLLEYLLKEVSFDPRELFGTSVDGGRANSFSTSDLAKQLGNYVLGVLREEDRRRNPPDNLPGGPKKQLMLLIPIVQTIIGFARSFHPSGTSVLASVHTWITPNWHRVVEKRTDKLGVDEKVWLNAMTPERQANPMALEGLGLLLVLVYAVHVHRRVLGAVRKLSSTKDAKECVEVVVAGSNNGPEENAELAVEALDSIVERIILNPQPITELERSALHKALMQTSICLERLIWWSWKIEVSPVDGQVAMARSWLRHILLKEKFEMFRLVKSLSIDDAYLTASMTSLELLRACREGTMERLEDTLIHHPASLSKSRRSTTNLSNDPLLYRTTIEKFIKQGILVVPEESRWENEVARISNLQRRDSYASMWNRYGKGTTVTFRGALVPWHLPQ